MHPPQLVLTRDDLHEVVDYFSARDEFAFDVETSGRDRGVAAVNNVTWMSLATHGAATVIPLGHPNGYELLRKASWRKNKATGERENLPAQFSDPPTQLRPSQVFEALRPLFFSNRTKIAHNATFDLLSIAKYYGGYPPPPYGDTIVAAWLLNENRPLGLKPLTKARYGLDYDHENVGKCVEAHPFGTVANYAWLDAKSTWLLWRHMRPQIDADGLAPIWGLEMDVLDCLLHTQAPGTPVDIAALNSLRDDLRRELVGREAGVYRAAGKVFNLGSTPQKQALLYGPPPEGQGLQPRRFTKTGAPSTDADALGFHKGNPLVDEILGYQELATILHTYVEGYLGDNEGRPSQVFDGRIYPSFAQYGTVTGRFSCRSPNVQNWPRPDTVWGKRIRDLVEPSPGSRLLVADYAQIELRILAHFAGPGRLWQGFWDGMDAHVATAAAVFGVPPEEVTKAMRQVAKGLAFAIIYGAGPGKLADMAGISVAKARGFMRTHEREFPEVYRYKDEILRTVRGRRPQPYLHTLLKRRRRLPDLLSPVAALRSRAERQVVNSHIQGTNADMTKLAMVRFNKTRLPGMQLLLTVHDELAVLCPTEIAEEGAKVLHEAMAGEDMQLLGVPVLTEVKICERWSEAK
ncbi:DNA polymerase [Saccharothrix sp. ST-888]|uniref:DNA polymerase n=1 Tax=Saccharothrix sp. ST-888 TaxID=1427391 RepID=UPI00069878F1|nr:DNA polymerase [Saccharothrix sp. ST-888]